MLFLNVNQMAVGLETITVNGQITQDACNHFQV